VLGLYAKGMTVRDIQAHLVEIYDVSVSPDLISKITDAVHAEVSDLAGPLALPGRDRLQSRRRRQREEQGGEPGRRRRHRGPARRVLGIWIETNGGTKFWRRVMNEFKARGVQDALIAVCDGLVGLPEAIDTVWPDTRVQTCIVHLICASLRWVNNKDRKRVAGLLRPICGTPRPSRPPRTP
jgi:putative transposase